MEAAILRMIIVNSGVISESCWVDDRGNPTSYLQLQEEADSLKWLFDE
jgi:hypothetical protein